MTGGYEVDNRATVRSGRELLIFLKIKIKSQQFSSPSAVASITQYHWRLPRRGSACTLVSASATGVRPLLLLFICAGTAVLG